MTLTVGDGAILLGMTLSALYLRHFLATYLAEKGKNLATREDVAEVTHQVEAVRMQYQTDLERIRADLSRRAEVNKSVYDAEFEAYRQIWDLLIPAHREVALLRPMIDRGLGPGETEDSRKLSRLQAFGPVFNAFSEQMWKHKPFYSAEVHAQLQELARLIHKETVAYEFGRPHQDEDYWLEARANAQEMSQVVDRICEAIRGRVSGPVA
jgi:hypothetical protein